MNLFQAPNRTKLELKQLPAEYQGIENGSQSHQAGIETTFRSELNETHLYLPIAPSWN